MPSASESDFQLEIGHVLLIDIVGYSKLLITEQREQLQALNRKKHCAVPCVGCEWHVGAAAKSTGEQALPLLEARLRERPDDVFAIRERSWIYLGLGRNEDALRLSRQAADLIPIEKDAVVGPSFQTGLAQIEARAGAPEEAIKEASTFTLHPCGRGRFCSSFEDGSGLGSDP